MDFQSSTNTFDLDSPGVHSCLDSKAIATQPWNVAHSSDQCVLLKLPVKKLTIVNFTAKYVQSSSIEGKIFHQWLM